MKEEDISKIILSILDIIEYEGDKQKYTQEFLGICMVRALDEMLKTLPDDQKAILKNEVSANLTTKDIESLLKRFSNENTYKTLLEESVGKTAEEFIQSVTPTLSVEQKSKLDQYLSSF